MNRASWRQKQPGAKGGRVPLGPDPSSETAPSMPSTSSHSWAAVVTSLSFCCRPLKEMLLGRRPWKGLESAKSSFSWSTACCMHHKQLSAHCTSQVTQNKPRLTCFICDVLCLQCSCIVKRPLPPSDLQLCHLSHARCGTVCAAVEQKGLVLFRATTACLLHTIALLQGGDLSGLHK